jgi:hypothetical protein
VKAVSQEHLCENKTGRLDDAGPMKNNPVSGEDVP